MTDPIRIRRALISVSDKQGLDALATCLTRHGVEILSTGGTYTYLTQTLGLPARKVEDVTAFPEMMHGRVKTLHPKIFGGILARREVPEDMKNASEHEIPIVDLVCVNLYPFRSHLDKPREEQIDFVDIGGPSLLRAAAKNHPYVTVLSDPSDYTDCIEILDSNAGNTSIDFRLRQAVRTYSRTSAYDAAITQAWGNASTEMTEETVSLVPSRQLRYGENPHQRAYWSGRQDWEILQGKELSYNNILDAEAAFQLALEFAEPAVAIIKHGNPCGTSWVPGGTILRAFEQALRADETSAFGGIVAANGLVDGPTAEKMQAIFLEVVIAPDFAPEALQVFSKKQNLRVVRWQNPKHSSFEVRKALGGWLVQDSDVETNPTSTFASDWKVVTKAAVTGPQKSDLVFAWKVAKHVRSNAIVIAKDGRTLGVGAGQMSRVDSVRIALSKAQAANAGSGSVLASDAFFPFRDNIDLLKGSGISAIIQPGGSKRDQEVVDACDELGIAMVFTGKRHFRH